MTVKELIEFLQTQPQDILVAYKIFSEQALLEPRQITIEDLCEYRPDGWISDKRPDMPTRVYLVFPGD